MLPDETDVLLVQDNPLEVELTLRPLRDLDPGWRIGVARDGEEALDYLLGRGAFRHRLGAPLPRLVLLDLKLPRVDGIEVLRALRASPRASSVPVVMLVPADEPRELAQCYQVGANSCVQKPVDYGSFHGTIQLIARYWLGENLVGGAAGQRGRGAVASG
ncbi:MAG TPA: response regulator [Gemmatimonadales bacterium]|jgi:two-component system response regulator|nr:response regulator [Gemmatimonadales bacterium]